MPKAEVDTVESAREKVEVRNAAVTDIVAAACRQVKSYDYQPRQVKSYDYQHSSPKLVNFLSFPRPERYCAKARTCAAAGLVTAKVKAYGSPATTEPLMVKL